MKRYIVAISIDKVQTFLYYVIHAHTQERQSNSGTLQSIIGASNLISKDFYEDMEEQFREEESLLKCSGVFIFSTDLSEREIKERCSVLFSEYYKKYNGQLLMKYTYFESAEVIKEASKGKKDEKIMAIEEGKRRLKQKECLNEIIKEHKDIIFQFQDVENISKKNIEREREETGVFVSEIDQLFPEEVYQNNNHFRIAVIKADLDNMGQLFKGKKDYCTYKNISDILTRFICIEKLKEYANEVQKEEKDFRLYPLYMAGDDIFFAVSANYLMKGIDICKEILRDINEEIREISKKNSLSMSIGVEFTFNREPIRYYYERVERQLETAKKEKRSIIEKDNKLEEIQKEMLDIQLSINHYVFFDITDNKEEKFYDKLENDKPQWKNFIDSISILKNAMEKGFKAHHFLYELLRKITDPKIYKDEVKYSNAVLYHLSPSYLNSSDKGLREAELLLIAILLKQVSEKEGKQYELKFDCKQKKKLENYVRLLLLFSDSNLKIKDEDKEFVKNTFDIKKIRSCVFNRVLRYLYTNNLDIKDEKENKEKKLKDIFVREEEYVSDLKDNKKKRMKIKVYRTLPIRSSMFYRIKNKIRKQDNKYIYHIITNIQNRTQDEIKQIEELHKKEYKAPPSLYFDTEGVDEIVNKIDKDYIDSLLIFYQFNQQSIQYKKIYPSEKISKKQKEC